MSKTAIITGANKGIGLAVAKDLIAKNYQVILACRDTVKGKMAEEFLGSNAVFLELDLSKKPFRQAYPAIAVSKIPAKKGGILESSKTKATITIA